MFRRRHEQRVPARKSIWSPIRAFSARLKDLARRQVVVAAGYAPKTIDHIHDVLGATLRSAVKMGTPNCPWYKSRSLTS